MTTDLPIKPDGLAQVQALLATGRQPPLGEKLEAVMDLEAGLIHPVLNEHLPQAVSV